MNLFTKKDTNDANLQDEINSILEEMASEQPDTDKYSREADNLEKVCRAKSYEHNSPIDINTIITAAASLGGIVLILNYEKLGVVTSKALSFIPKLRV
jgi:hypothetical protein